MKQGALMVANNAAGGVRQPRKLSEVTENSGPRAGSVVVVTAFGLTGCGRPVRSWVVSSLCPFGCAGRMHASASGWNFPRFEGEGVEYCPGAARFYSVIVPESLQLAALRVTVVES